MPLSEHEQRLLDQMERAILTEDPRFASTFKDTIKQVGKKSGTAIRPGLGIFAIVLGVATLIVAVSISQPVLTPILGVLGFVVIVLSLSSLISSIGQKQEHPARTENKSKKSFMQGLEERWNNRSDS